MSGENIDDQYTPSYRIEDNILIGAEVTDPGCKNVGKLVLDRLRSKPDFIGQVEAASEKETTYAEMAERSVKCALWLKKHGIQKGDKVGIWTDNHLDTYAPVFACLYVAAVICPWDHNVTKMSAQYCLSLTSPKVIFVNAESVKNLIDAAKENNLEIKIVVIGNIPGFISLTDILEEQIISSEIDEFCCTEVKDCDLAMICSSSGTTGMPKGAELSYASLYNSITPIEEVHLINEVSLWMSTIRWHYGLVIIIEVIISNSKKVIIPDNVNEVEVCKVIQKYGVTWFGSAEGIPLRFLKYNTLQKYPLPTLKKIVISGAPFTKKLHEALATIMPHTLILQCYGLTDAGGLCVSQTKNSKPGSCGFVTKGVRLKVIDEKTGETLGANKKGELCIKSEFVMIGYHKNPEETKEAIDSNGWLHTKDIVYYDEEGEIYYVSRVSDFINYISIKLSPSEIEGTLKLHPSVLKAAVIPVPHETDEEHPMAFIQKVAGKEIQTKKQHTKMNEWATATVMDNIKVKTEIFDYQDVVRRFRIKNNILIGHELPINRKAINMSEVLLNILKSKPNCIGQVDAVTGKMYTFADMTERSIKCALWLKKQGVKPGDIVGLCTDNHLDAIIIMLGTMYIGAISNTGDHKLSAITAQYFLSQTSPSIMFVVSSSAASVTEAVKKLKFNTKIVVLEETNGYESLENVLRDHDSHEIAEFKCVPVSKPDEIALLVSSSGTTGTPKSTEISHFSLYSCLLPEKVTEMKGHICTWSPTLRWHYGVQLAFQAIMAYSTRIIAPDCNNDTAYCEIIEKYKITFFSSDPCMLIRFVKTDLLKKYRLPTLKIIEVSGAHFGKKYHEALAEKLPHSLILNGYGLTDSGGDVSVQVKGCKPGSIGFVAPNVKIKVIDIKTENILGANQIGELRVKLPCVMNGYYKNREATKRAFDSDNWLRTGDLGYYDDDGEIYIIDRISEFINFGSINVSPAEIEYVLGTHPSVLHAVVIGIPHEVDEQHPMAVVTLVPGKTVTEQELIDLVEKNMPDHCKLRAGVKFLDKLPRTVTGKIAKKKLREMFAH